jgi:putative thioredoxin
MEPTNTDIGELAGINDELNTPKAKDSSTSEFRADVIEASNNIIIIVDFWATWCGPCKTLTPILEKVIAKSKGLVELVKIDVDKNPELSEQLRIQSIPAVIAFSNGQPIDAFQGALPESEVQKWVDQLISQHGGNTAPSPVEEALMSAEQAFEDNDISSAGALYAQVLNIEEKNTKALAGMAKCYLKAEKIDKAREIIDKISDELSGDENIRSVISAVELAEASSSSTDDTENLRKISENDPNNLQAKFNLGIALYGNGEAEASIDTLIEIIRENRDWQDGEARQQLLKIFEAHGPTDPITILGRRKLSSVLFS